MQCFNTCTFGDVVQKTRKNEAFPLNLPKRVFHIVWALYYIVVEVTMNMTEYTSSCQF